MSKTAITAARALILLRAHILNPLWHNSAKRRESRGKAIEKVVTGYLRRHYLSAADNMAGFKPEAATEPERIFSIWFQGEENAPDLIKSCFASIRDHCPQELVVLDEKSIFDWISLPEEIVRKFREGKIKYAHFADICRVELLYRHGGIWLDSTCFVSAPIPRFMLDQDFFVYMAGTRVHGNYSFMQNCFIRARKGSWLLAAWREMILAYWLAEDGRIEYFQHQLMFKVLVKDNPIAAELFAKMPQIDQAPTHVIWYEDADKPFDADKLRTISEDGFFYQKTTYRNSDNPLPGSVKEYIEYYWERNR